MLSVRWRKLLGDVHAERGRLALMISAISVSLVAVVAVLGAWSILRREIAVNYLGTRPAAATLELTEDIDARVLERVRAIPNVAEAVGREVIRARVQVGNDWRPMLLFVADDYDDLRLNRFYHESGAWPPPAGTVLLERSALAMANAKSGSTLRIKTPTGNTESISVSGIAYDPGLAPAWQERSVYAYATRATLSALGEAPAVHEMRVTFGSAGSPMRAVEAAADELARQLVALGLHPTEIRVPPPGEHPHQRQMTTILLLLSTFAALSLVLSSILVATSLASMLARQIREIAVMKTVGGTSRQLAGMYAALVVAIGLVSIVVATPLGIYGAHSFARAIAGMLNFNITDASISPWVYGIQIGAGLAIPIALATIPIARAARMTVRTALDQHGASSKAVFQILALFPVVVRNAMRRPSRFALTVGLLATGGALFMTSLAVSKAWVKNVDKIYETRLYDVEVRLHAAAPSALIERLSTLPDTRTLEVWDYSPAAFARIDRVDLVRTYPDKGHGSLSVMAPPLATRLVKFPLVAGRWLSADERDTVVLNHVAAAQRPLAKIGDVLSLSIGGHVCNLTLAGIVEEVGSPGVAYLSSAAFSQCAEPQQKSRLIRISTTGSTAFGRAKVVSRIENVLVEQKVGVESVVPFSELRTAIGDHIVILTRALVAMAVVLAIVGILGLGSAMGISVVERTREIGVMKAIGATSRRIVSSVVSEALFTAAASYIAAILLSLPLTWFIEGLIGRLGFLAPLPFVVSPAAILGWAGLLGVAALGATIPPAYRAAGLSVREALVVTG